jgi:hypothetical protein
MEPKLPFGLAVEEDETVAPPGVLVTVEMVAKRGVV